MKLPPSSRLRFAEFRRRVRERDQGKDNTQAEPKANADGLGPPRRAQRPDLDKQTRRRYMWNYAAMLRPHAAGLAALVVLTLGSAGVGFVQPWLTQRLLDHAILDTARPAAERVALMNRLGVAMIALAVGGVALSMWRGYLSTIVSARVVYRMRARLLSHLLRLPIPVLAEMKTGGVASRLSGDVSAAATLVQSAVIQPATAALQAATALVILITWNWKLALAVAGAAMPLVAMHWLYVRRIRPVWRSIHEDMSRLDGRATETFGGIRVVRVFRREGRAAADDAVGQHTATRKQSFAAAMERWVESGWALITPGITLVIIWYGGYLVVQDQLRGAPNPTTVGQLFAFQVYILMLLGPVMRLVNSISQTQRSLAAMERVFDVLDKPVDKPDAPDAVDVRTLGPVRELRLNAVSFSYRQDVPVLRDISFTTPGGTMTALVGPSGAGKTTLTDLIARFHDPTAGAILLNGTDLRKIRLGTYRSLLAVVQQETFLFDGTIRDNIALGRRGASDEEVRAAARRANADEFIDTLPERYDTLIGERGLKLSGGQRQRLAIARAILADPAILILDEATSSLDTRSEQLIQAALDELYRDRTTFVIAHRLSTITHADQIVVLDQGRVAQLGTHDQLMSAPGLYRDMVERQRDAFDTAEAI